MNPRADNADLTVCELVTTVSELRLAVGASDPPPPAPLKNLRKRLDKAEAELRDAFAALRAILGGPGAADDGLLPARSRAIRSLARLSAARMKYLDAGGEL